MKHLKHAFWTLTATCALLLVAGCSSGTNTEDSSGATKDSGVPALAVNTIEEVLFNEHVRPILSDNCFACHGPDADNQESPFRLDSQEASRMNLAKEGEPARFGIVPGKPEESTLLTRIQHPDPNERMPPVATKKKDITPEEIAILRQWILDGAEYKEHWAFVKPEKSAPPEVQNTAWVRNEIDRFILAKLEKLNIATSPEADKETLIRRVYMDLIGLPPTPEQIDTYVSE